MSPEHPARTRSWPGANRIHKAGRVPPRHSVPRFQESRGPESKADDSGQGSVCPEALSSGVRVGLDFKDRHFQNRWRHLSLVKAGLIPGMSDGRSGPKYPTHQAWWPQQPWHLTRRAMALSSTHPGLADFPQPSLAHNPCLSTSLRDQLPLRFSSCFLPR